MILFTLIFLFPVNYIVSQDIEPQSPDPAYNLIIEGNQLAEQGYLEDAIKRYDYALEINPDNILALLNRAQVKYWSWQYKEAIEDYTKLIDIDPNVDALYLDRGLCYAYLGLFNEAIDDWTDSIKLKSEFNPAYLYRGCAYKILGKDSKFKKDYDIALQYYRNDAYFYNQIAQFVGLNINPEYNNVDFGLEMADKANEITNWEDLEIVYTIAELYFQKALDRNTGEIDEYQIERAINLMNTIFKSQNYYKSEMNGYYIYRFYKMIDLWNKLDS